MKRVLLVFVILLSISISFAATVIQETYVVVVGIAAYQNIPSLNLPEKDAQSIAKLYKTKTKHVILLTGKYATKHRILESLKQQFARAKKGDKIVFAFSGHGYPGGICPYDMSKDAKTGITYRKIQTILKNSKATGKFVFADACFSGGLRTKPTTSENYTGNLDVLFFLSSRSGETSIESPFMVNGYFTTFLVRGLRGGADTNHDRKITAKELFVFVNQRVVEKSNNQQHPVMWGHFDDADVVMEW